MGQLKNLQAPIKARHRDDLSEEELATLMKLADAIASSIRRWKRRHPSLSTPLSADEGYSPAARSATLSR